MKNVIAISRREFRSYFNSPVAYIALTVFLILIGLTFFFKISFLIPKDDFFDAKEADLRPLFEWSIFIFTIILPAISMKLIAEEKKLGTLEVLLTMPVSDLEIVLGKLFGSMGFLLVAIAFTFIYPVVISFLGKPDLGPIIGGYFGVFLIGTSYLSIGLMTSSWTSSQIIAFILALLICLFFAFVDRMTAVFGPSVQEIISYISFNYHYRSISRGVIDSRDILFFLSVITATVMITTYSLESRKWK
jgi:ABC-2 type transport system permease protein